MKVYHYHPVTGESVGESEARLSPLHLRRGVSVPLVPANATTVAPPTLPAGQRAVFDGAKWKLKPLEHIVLTTAKKLHRPTFETAVRASFPGAVVSGENFEEAVSKEIRLEGVEDTTANRSAVQAIIDAHDYAAIIAQVEADKKDIAKLDRRLRAVLQSIVKEQRKINPTFPDFDALRLIVQAEYDALED